MSRRVAGDNPLKTATDKQVRLLEIEEELHDIVTTYMEPGNEHIPVSDASFQSWEYAQASDFTTLYCAGGFGDQPTWWLHDVGLYNTFLRYAHLEQEHARILADLSGA